MTVRQAWIAALCAVLGLAYALTLHRAMHPRVAPLPPGMGAPVRVEVKLVATGEPDDYPETPQARSAQRKLVAAAEDVSQPQLPVLAEAAAAPASGRRHPPAQVDEPQSSPPLSPAVTETPATESLDEPPDFELTDAPHGNVAVIALKVGEAGRVLDVKLVLASSRPMEDLTFVMMSRGLTWPALKDLPPGETRWVPWRIQYKAAVAAERFELP